MLEVADIPQGVVFAATAALSGLLIAASRQRVSSEVLALGLERQARTLALIALVAHGFVFLHRASDMLDRPILDLQAAGLGLIAAQTRFGTVWLLQASLLLASTVCSVGFARLTLAAGFAMASLVALPLDSHLLASESSLVSRIANLAHVVLGAVWFGGIVVLLSLWRIEGRAASPRLAGRLARFSRLALPVMLAVLLSGVLLARETVGRWAALFATDYGVLLLFKLVLVGVVLALAARLRRALVEGPQPLIDVRLLAAEAALALLIALLAGVIAQTTPGAHASIDWWMPFRLVPEVAWGRPGVPVQVITGGGLCVLATLALWLWRARPAKPGLRTLRWGSALAFVAGFGVAAQALSVAAYATTYAKPVARYAANDIAAGAELYATHCVSCHGVQGHGNGPAAAGLRPAPADLTAPHVGDHTSGDMYWWLTHGIKGSAMPSFASQIDERGRWQLVMYLMALSHGHQARAIAGEIVPREPWLPAIDLPLDSDSEVGSLLETRGTRAHWLLFVRDKAVLDQHGEEWLLSAQVLASANIDIDTVLVLPPALSSYALAHSGRGLQMVVDRDGHIAQAWSHYRRSFEHPDFDDREPFPSGVGYLIDRFGFVRARWRADEGKGLPDIGTVLAAARALAEEPEIRGADEHLH